MEYTNHDIKECILEATLEDIEAIFWLTGGSNGSQT